MATPYFFSMINPAIVVMGALFLIFFALLVYILSKVFRDKYGNVSTITVGIISFCISVLIIYFGRDTIYNIIEGLRLSNIILYVLSGIAILVLLYLFRRRLRFCMVLMLIGAGLILIGALTDFFYQKEFVIIIGIILLLLGIWLCARGRPARSTRGPRRRRYPRGTRDPPSPRGGRRPPRGRGSGGSRTPAGEASLDVIIGRKHLTRSGRADLDLMRSNSTVIYVQNGGTGGRLGWRASSNRELSLSKSSGRLAVGKTHAITVTVRDRSGRKHAGVIINGRGAGRLGGRATRGRILIYFRIR